jgi:hypothetical protein
MSDTARDYQSIEPASTKGLEEIFEVRELDASRDELDATPLSVEQIAVSNTHLELIRELQHKNEALIFCTGYLPMSL